MPSTDKEFTEDRLQMAARILHKYRNDPFVLCMFIDASNCKSFCTVAVCTNKNPFTNRAKMLRHAGKKHPAPIEEKDEERNMEMYSEHMQNAAATMHVQNIVAANTSRCVGPQDNRELLPAQVPLRFGHDSFEPMNDFLPRPAQPNLSSYRRILPAGPVDTHQAPVSDFQPRLHGQAIQAYGNNNQFSRSGVANMLSLSEAPEPWPGVQMQQPVTLPPGAYQPSVTATNAATGNRFLHNGQSETYNDSMYWINNPAPQVRDTGGSWNSDYLDFSSDMVDPALNSHGYGHGTAN